MKRETLFLKAVVFLIGIPVFAVCTILVPMIIKETAASLQLSFFLPVLVAVYVAAIPFFAALYQAFKLLSYIDQNRAFSELSVKALKNIKYCAILISILYAADLPFLVLIADSDDAPGLAGIAIVILFASIVITVFAAVLQKLLKNAIDIKSENDLTI